MSTKQRRLVMTAKGQRHVGAPAWPQDCHGPKGHSSTPCSITVVVSISQHKMPRLDSEWQLRKHEMQVLQRHVLLYEDALQLGKARRRRLEFASRLSPPAGATQFDVEAAAFTRGLTCDEVQMALERAQQRFAELWAAFMQLRLEQRSHFERYLEDWEEHMPPGHQPDYWFQTCTEDQL
jgi:hypothetical protein